MDELLASQSQGYHLSINSSVLIYTPDWREALCKIILFRKNTTYSTPVDLFYDPSQFIAPILFLVPISLNHCLQCEKHMLITIHTVYILCTVHFMESPNVVFAENDTDSYLGQPVFQSTPTTSGETNLSNFTVFLTQNFKHIMVNGITIWWNAVSQLI